MRSPYKPQGSQASVLATFPALQDPPAVACECPTVPGAQTMRFHPPAEVFPSEPLLPAVTELWPHSAPWNTASDGSVFQMLPSERREGTCAVQRTQIFHSKPVGRGRGSRAVSNTAFLPTTEKIAAKARNDRDVLRRGPNQDKSR